MVLREGLLMEVIGVALGLAGAVALSRVVQGLLFEVQPSDPLALASGSAVMLVSAIAACLPSPHRATRVDPMVLRAE